MAHQPHIRKRHRFFRALALPIARFYAALYGFRKERYKSREGEQFLVLANHQATLDPLFVCSSFSFLPYIVASDHLDSDGLGPRLLRYCFAPIYKHKAAADIKCIRTCLRVVKEGGSILLFPEGNRAWADYAFYIDPSVVKFIRMLKLPVLLYRIAGGYGVDPRWGGKRRKGQFSGGVVRKLTCEEIDAMDDETLYQTVVQTLRSIDADSGQHYTSPRRAEYLERLLFLCPRCGKVETLTSQGAQIRCESCGLTAEYGEDLRLHSTDPDFPFRRLVEWYNRQKQWVAQYEATPEAVIWREEQVTVTDYSGKKPRKCGAGPLCLTAEELSFAGITLPTAEICAATVIGGTKLSVSTAEASYLIRGAERFNGVKYLLMFHRLNTLIKEDKYYGLGLEN